MEEMAKEVQDEMDAALASLGNPMTIYPTTAGPGTPWFSTAAMTAAAPSPVFTGTTTFVGTTVAAGGGHAVAAAGAAGLHGMGHITFAPPAPPAHIITLSHSGREIVRLNNDGSVTWNEEIDIDAASEAFARSIVLGAEVAAGITKKVKLNMRDSVFEDLIAIAKDKGSLTAEDLTYLLQASKIVEKLKGSKE